MMGYDEQTQRACRKHEKTLEARRVIAIMEDAERNQLEALYMIAARANCTVDEARQLCIDLMEMGRRAKAIEETLTS